jgi:hypothetical protein
MGGVNAVSCCPPVLATKGRPNCPAFNSLRTRHKRFSSGIVPCTQAQCGLPASNLIFPATIRVPSNVTVAGIPKASWSDTSKPMVIAQLSLSWDLALLHRSADRFCLFLKRRQLDGRRLLRGTNEQPLPRPDLFTAALSMRCDSRRWRWAMRELRHASVVCRFEDTLVAISVSPCPTKTTLVAVIRLPRGGRGLCARAVRLVAATPRDRITAKASRIFSC